MEGKAFQSLVDSIAVHGVQNPIVSYKGEMLDGRNRLRAVMKLRDEGHKVELPCVEWDSKCGITVTEWIAAQNFDRRHLTEDARAMIGAQLITLIKAEAKKAKKDSQFNSDTGKAAASKKATPAVTADSPSPQKRDRKKSEERTTAAQAAKKAKVSTHKMKQAMAVDKAVEAGEIAPEVVQEIKAGKKKVKDALPAKSKKKPTKPPASDDVASEIRAAAVKSWQRLKDRFAINEHDQLRKVMADIIREEQKQGGK
jgi:ParB-like chromosome segregation protein Spo0J